MCNKSGLNSCTHHRLAEFLL